MLHVGKKVAKGSLTPNFFFVFIVCDNRNDQMKIKIIKNGIEYLSRLSMVVVVLVTLIFAIHVFFILFLDTGLPKRFKVPHTDLYFLRHYVKR